MPCNTCTSPKACAADGVCYQQGQRGALNGEILPPAKDLDPEKIVALAEAIYHEVQNHYMRSGGLSPMNVLEALNALAVVAGTIIQGTELDAKPFFLQALDIQLKMD